jgi:hypothetical protein
LAPDRQKILVAGLDIAAEAAAANKLPPVNRNEDILEAYSTFHTLELAYRMGLLDRPEWKRLSVRFCPRFGRQLLRGV